MMATFEQGSSADSDVQQYQKFPLRRLEPAIQKFLKVIQIDLARLHRHRLNLEKFNRLTDWTSLHTEQVNATRTVQQVKANLHEIEKCRLQVREEDLQTFDDKIHAMKHSALRSLREFVDVALPEEKSNSRSSSSDSSPGDELKTLSVQLSDQGQRSTDLTPDESQIFLNEIPENTEVAQSWENLQENLEELNQMIHQFANAVNDQQENLDRIEDNVENAHESVRAGTLSLGKASKLRSAMFPVAGAVIGTIVGGPVGLVAGAKLGGVVGVMGGAAGFFGGRFWKKRQDQTTDIELSKVSRHSSLPDIHEPDSSVNGSFFSMGRTRNQSSPVAEGDTGSA